MAHGPLLRGPYCIRAILRLACDRTSPESVSLARRAGRQFELAGRTCPVRRHRDPKELAGIDVVLLFAAVCAAERTCRSSPPLRRRSWPGRSSAEEIDKLCRRARIGEALSRMVAAMRVKSPFSQRALFGFGAF